jgi:mRNA interferase MazF
VPDAETVCHIKAFDIYHNCSYNICMAFGCRGQNGQIALDQIRTIDTSRLIIKLGAVDPQTQIEVITILQRLFAF